MELQKSGSSQTIIIKGQAMDSDLNNIETQSESDTQAKGAKGAKGYDPYLITAVNNSQGSSSPVMSENIAVALDDMAGTCTRRRATLLQLQGKHADS